MRFEEGLKSFTDTEAAIDDFQNSRTDNIPGILVIDEALGCGFEDIKWARVRMDMLLKSKTRLLLIDANFPDKEQYPTIGIK